MATEENNVTKIIGIQTDISGKDLLTKYSKEEIVKAIVESLSDETIEDLCDTIARAEDVAVDISKLITDNIENINGFLEFAGAVEQASEEEINKIEKVVKDALLESDKDIPIVKESYSKPKSSNQILLKLGELIFDVKTDWSEIRQISVGKLKSKGKEEKAIVKAMLSSAVWENDDMPTNLTPYDKEVLNGIFTIYMQGYSYMTTRQIYYAMTGREAHSPQMLSAVTKSINKMRKTFINIDWTDHARMQGINISSDLTIITEKPILPIGSTVKIISGGKKIEAYYFSHKDPEFYPPLFTYAMETKQISTTQMKVLQIPDISNTEENITIKNYLIREVEHIYNSKDWNRTITFNRLFSKCDIETSAKNLPRKRKVVFDILDYWKSISYIANYETIKNGRVYYGIKILPFRCKKTI